MAAPVISQIQLMFLSVACLFISGVVSTAFTITNKCDHTVWPGVLSNADAPALSTTGFTLQKGETKTITAPSSWGGRMWGRTHCSQDSAGKFWCLTDDCGSGKFKCSGSGANPPATLAEFKLDGYGGMDYFDVSLIDGYNLPLNIVPQGGSGQNCSTTGCVADLNSACPTDLKVISDDGETVACKSACEAFRHPQYCCNGAYSTPDTCKPSSYSQIFKNACPLAHSYAYDNKTSTFTCSSADYLITFCPSISTSQNSTQGQSANTASTSNSPGNSTMVNEGALATSVASPSTFRRVLRSRVIFGVVTVAICCLGLLERLVRHRLMNLQRLFTVENMEGEGRMSFDGVVSVELTTETT